MSYPLLSMNIQGKDLYDFTMTVSFLKIGMKENETLELTILLHYLSYLQSTTT